MDGVARAGACAVEASSGVPRTSGVMTEADAAPGELESAGRGSTLESDSASDPCAAAGSRADAGAETEEGAGAEEQSEAEKMTEKEVEKEAEAGTPLETSGTESCDRETDVTRRVNKNRGIHVLDE